MKAGTCPFHHGQVEGIESFDMLDPVARANPFPYYHWLSNTDDRRVYEVPQENGFYAVHKYDDVKWVLQNPVLFANDILPTSKSPFFALMDGEDHARIRSVAAKIFLTKDEDLEAQIRKSIQHYSIELINNESPEVFSDWATPIAISTLCHVFGLDAGSNSIKEFHQAAITINKALFVVGGTGPRRSTNPTFGEKIKIASKVVGNYRKYFKLKKLVGKEGIGEFKAMFRPVKTKEPLPRPDFKVLPDAIEPLFSLILQFAELLNNESSDVRSIEILQREISIGTISKMEACMICAFVMFAGYETTTSLLSNSIYHLSKEVDLIADLKKNPKDIDGFINEMARVYTPVHRFLRRATNDVKIGDKMIPKGSIVILMLGAANVDQNAFDNPYELETDRKANHLAFGKGVHYCLGATLAHYQIKTALLELLSVVKKIELLQEENLKMVTDRDNGIFRFQELKIQVSI